jgi:hypothetical protein
MKNKEVVKIAPMNLSPEGEAERLEAIQKLAKRVNMLMRELEVYTLDMSMYSKSLSRGHMPRNYVEDVGRLYSDASKELRLVSEAWTNVFKEVADDSVDHHPV